MHPYKLIHIPDFLPRNPPASAISMDLSNNHPPHILLHIAMRMRSHNPAKRAISLRILIFRFKIGLIISGYFSAYSLIIAAVPSVEASSCTIASKRKLFFASQTLPNTAEYKIHDYKQGKELLPSKVHFLSYSFIYKPIIYLLVGIENTYPCKYIVFLSYLSF